MSARAEQVLVIYDASPGCVACCAMAPDSRKVTLWAPPCPGGNAASIRSAMTHQARVLDLGEVCEADLGGVASDHPGPLGETRMLLAALERAVEIGCARVIWPVVCGPDLEAMTAAAETAELVTRLGWIAFPRASARIETPLADLTPAQVQDLLADLRAPADLMAAPAAG